MRVWTMPTHRGKREKEAEVLGVESDARLGSKGRDDALKYRLSGPAVVTPSLLTVQTSSMSPIGSWCTCTQRFSRATPSNLKRGSKVGNSWLAGEVCCVQEKGKKIVNYLLKGEIRLRHLCLPY